MKLTCLIWLGLSLTVYGQTTVNLIEDHTVKSGAFNSVGGNSLWCYCGTKDNPRKLRLDFVSFPVHVIIVDEMNKSIRDDIIKSSDVTWIVDGTIVMYFDVPAIRIYLSNVKPTPNELIDIHLTN